MKRLLNFRIVCLLSALAGVILAAEAQKGSQFHWSVDLNEYGYSQEPDGTARIKIQGAALAASANRIGVAMWRDGKFGGITGAAVKSPPETKISIFDAESGKLLDKCGPWSGWLSGDFWITSQGNFLLHVHPPKGSDQVSKDSVLLLNPSCQLLRQIDVSSSLYAGQIFRYFFVSETGKKMLVVEYGKEDSGYELFDTETLEPIKKWWFEGKTGGPSVVAISDRGILATNGPTPFSEDGSRFARYGCGDQFEYRTFEGAWRELDRPVPGDGASNCSAFFLSDDTIVEVRTVGPQRAWSPLGTRILVWRLDGSVLSSMLFSKSASAVAPASRLALSAGGKYFAFSLNFQSVNAVAKFFDMAPPGPTYAYIWSSADTKLIEKLRLHTGSSFIGGPMVAISPDGAWYGYIDSSSLTVRPLRTH